MFEFLFAKCMKCTENNAKGYTDETNRNGDSNEPNGRSREK